MFAKKPNQIKQIDAFPAGDLSHSLTKGETFRHETVFTMWPLSDLAVYRVMIYKDGKAQPNDFRNGLYWKDNHNLGGVGPFTGEYMAMEHYKAYKVQLRAIVRMKEDGITPQAANVLHIDFKSGRKLPL